MTTTTLTPNSIAVTGLPESTKNAHIKENSAGQYIQYAYLNDQGKWRLNTSDYLPLGNWRILNFAQSMTEEQWREVVERHDLYEGELYYNYEGDIFFTSATPSGHSLLKAEGLELLNTLILINDEKH